LFLYGLSSIILLRDFPGKVSKIFGKFEKDPSNRAEVFRQGEISIYMRMAKNSVAFLRLVCCLVKQFLRIAH